MSPLVTEVVEGLSSRLRSPLLIFLLTFNIGFLGFVYYAVTDRRAKDHELMQALLKECVNVMERRPAQ